MCSMPGFGLDGPYSEFPAFGSTAEAMSGIVSMMGYEENHPIQTGMSYATEVLPGRDVSLKLIYLIALWEELVSISSQIL